MIITQHHTYTETALLPKQRSTNERVQLAVKPEENIIIAMCSVVLINQNYYS